MAASAVKWAEWQHREIEGADAADNPAAPTVQLFTARFSETDSAAWMRALKPLLTDQELRHGHALGGRDQRITHLLGRAILRLIGATGSDLSPAELTIGQDRGRPYLPQLPELRTSISHTGRFVVVAACRNLDLGVDAEGHPPPTVPLKRLAERFFAEEEADRLRALPPETVEREFWSYWTAKEAVGKALGTGIIPQLRGTVVRRNETGRTLVSMLPGAGPARWTLHQLTVPVGGELISVAVPAPDVALGVTHVISAERLASGSL